MNSEITRTDRLLASWILAATAIVAVLLLAACKSNSPPPPTNRAIVSMDPARWVFQHSPNMPAKPSVHPDGWTFDFPSRDGVHYLVQGTSGFLAGTVQATFRIEGEAKFEQSDPCESGKASVRLYFQRRGDTGTAEYQDYRWWSKQLILAPGSHVLSAPIIGSEWTQVFAKSGAERAQSFAAATADPTAVGVTFGGCFAGHGVYVSSGSARFIMTGFAVQ